MTEKRSMNIGLLGDSKIIIKRKFRYTLTIDTKCPPTTDSENGQSNGHISEHFVKVASRPQLEIEEQELNFLNAVTWIPGKAKWQPLSVTYIDVCHSEMESLYKWIATIYDFTDPTNLTQAEKSDWDGTAILTMFDGCGNPIERWTLGSVWPQSINFGDLDYASSEECTIDLTLRY